MNALFMVLIQASDGRYRMCVRRRQGNGAAYFVCGLHISDSAECSPSMKQIYICCSRNNPNPTVMLTLVYTQTHVALPHDYICVALNKMTHLTLSNNSAVIAVRECEIVFCRQLAHCHGSRTSEIPVFFLLNIILGVIYWRCIVKSTNYV